jgi:hypothetical protein
VGLSGERREGCLGVMASLAPELAPNTRGQEGVRRHYRPEHSLEIGGNLHIRPRDGTTRHSYFRPCEIVMKLLAAIVSQCA